MAISDENRFFKFLWRVNAVLIAFFALIGFLVGAFILYMTFSGVFRERNVRNVVNVSSQAVEQDKFEFGYPYMIDGSNYLRIALNRDQKYYVGSFPKSKVAASRVNFLFLNVIDGSSRWLASGHDQLIASDLMLFDSLETSEGSKSDDDLPRKPSRIIYQVIEVDSDANGLMTDKDKVSVFTSGIDGSGYTRLIEAADQVLMTRQTTDEQFIVMYNKDGQTHYQVFDVRDAKPVFDGKIELPASSGNADSD